MPTDLSGTVGTLKDMDRQARHQSWEDFVKLLEILQRIQHQGFLSCLPGLALILTEIFAKQCKVAGLKHHLENKISRELNQFHQVFAVCTTNGRLFALPCSRKQKCHRLPSDPCSDLVWWTSTLHLGDARSCCQSGKAMPHLAKSSEKSDGDFLWCGHAEGRSCHGQMPSQFKKKSTINTIQCIKTHTKKLNNSVKQYYTT